MEPGSHVVVIGHDLRAILAQALALQSDGSVIVTYPNPEPKAAKAASGADWPNAVVRVVGIETTYAKAKRLVAAENAKAEAEGRDAVCPDIKDVMKDTVAFASDVSTFLDTKDGKDIVRAAGVALDEPDLYRAPEKAEEVEEADPPPKQPTPRLVTPPPVAPQAPAGDQAAPTEPAAPSEGADGDSNTKAATT
jgi:hypothetical protein